VSNDWRLATRAFDGAYARWVLCFVRRPGGGAPAGRTAAEARRRVCDSGLLQLRTSRHRAAVRKAFRPVFRAVHNSWRVRWRRSGNRLPVARSAAPSGFEVREINPLLRLARPGSPLWDWPDTFFDIYLPVLLKMRLITFAHERAFRPRVEETRRGSPDAFFTSPPMVEIIAVKK
jgi:hypothetical protein